jgi:hypothetical protein
MLGTRFAKLAEENHHAYVTCKRWVDAAKLEFEISAYGDANPKGVRTRGQLNAATGEIIGR